MEYVGIPSVIVICYLVAEAIKLISNNNEKLKKVIPIIVAIFGGILTGVIFLMKILEKNSLILFIKNSML